MDCVPCNQKAGEWGWEPLAFTKLPYGERWHAVASALVPLEKYRTLCGQIVEKGSRICLNPNLATRFALEDVHSC